MTQTRVSAVFMRGGSSKGVFFHARDLPKDRMEWDRIFLGAIAQTLMADNLMEWVVVFHPYQRRWS